jgi:hypothetical protein
VEVCDHATAAANIKQTTKQIDPLGTIRVSSRTALSQSDEKMVAAL